jgi:hypothetical protein
LENPFLWPQLWEANRYIKDPHWIYPGDPLVIPDLDVLRAAEEEPGVEGPPGVAEAEPGVGAEGPGGPTGPNLIPLFEEISIQCAGYVSDKENEDFRIFGSEEGDRKIGLTMGDIVYLNRGTRDGIKPGDKYYIQERDRKIPGHGWYISRTGWLNVLAVPSSRSNRSRSRWYRFKTQSCGSTPRLGRTAARSLLPTMRLGAWVEGIC